MCAHVIQQEGSEIIPVVPDFGLVLIFCFYKDGLLNLIIDWGQYSFVFARSYHSIVNGITVIVVCMHICSNHFCRLARG